MSINQVKLASILQAPIVSEKTSNAADSSNQFVFKVQNSATKLQIRAKSESLCNKNLMSLNV